MTNLQLKHYPTNWRSADKVLDAHAQIKLGYKTWLVRLSTTEIAVYHHQTAIIHYYWTGALRLTPGGWYSRTTICRLNDLTPFHCYHRNGEAMVSDGYNDMPLSDAEGIEWPQPGGLWTTSEIESIPYP